MANGICVVCQTDDLTLIKDDDVTILLQAIIFVSPLPKEVCWNIYKKRTSLLLFPNM